MRKKILFFSIISALSLSLMMTSPTVAKPFYEGKTIKIIVGYKPGGGYDFYGRFVAKYMQKYLPGSTIIVKNAPGAGSVIAANEIYLSKPDGLTLGTFSRALPAVQLAGIKAVKYDMAKFGWLGSPCSEIYGLYASSKKYKSLDDIIKAKHVRMATDSLGSVSYLTTLLFFKMMELENYTFGTGYSGGELDLSIVRGEMDALFGSYYSRQGIMDSGDATPFLFIGKSKPAGYEHVPYIQDIVTDKKHKPAYDFLIGLNVVGRPFVGPPGIPKDRLTILRKAFKKAVEDPESIKFAKKANRPLSFISPESCEEWVKGIFELPPDVVANIKAAFGIK